MATPAEKLATSLEVLKELQDKGITAIRSSDITRTHRERLTNGGFLKEVMKGWYIPARPDETLGESTAWFTSYWDFCAAYLTERFGSDWSLSPEQSLHLHAGNQTVPIQLLVRAVKARNQVTDLVHGTSIFEVRANLPAKNDCYIDGHGLKLFSLPSALLNSFEDFYVRNPVDARTVLATFRDASGILELLLDGGHSVIAGRISGAFRNIGRDRIADDIIKGMGAAGYNVRELDPFTAPSPIVINPRELSPYVNRLKLMWQNMRNTVIENFPLEPGLPKDKEAYLNQVKDNYTKDAYNSLSIEGYRVSIELIERVRSGQWEPDNNEVDRQQRDAMAARGYWQAYQQVLESIEKILNGANGGEIADYDHQEWYREMFAPSVAAGILKASDLAGYRNQPVFIRQSQHVPPSAEAVRDLIPTFFELLATEEHAGVRAVLGHFIFVYIHPYIDGNGRIGRFLMNTMLASGGYSWIVIPVERRVEYMAALETASTQQDIGLFSQFIASLI